MRFRGFIKAWGVVLLSLVGACTVIMFNHKSDIDASREVEMTDTNADIEMAPQNPRDTVRGGSISNDLNKNE